MVLNDEETYTTLAGCKIVEIDENTLLTGDIRKSDIAAAKVIHTFDENPPEALCQQKSF